MRLVNEKVYFCSDQFGVKFIAPIESTLTDWVVFIQSYKITDVIHGFTKSKGQFKKSHFERLLASHKYCGYFKGCIEIPIEIIDTIRKGDLPNITNYPYLQIVNGELQCKGLSKEDYRNIQIGKLI